MPVPPPSRSAFGFLLRRESRGESRRVAELSRKETVSGGFLLAAALVALLWRNSPWGGAYQRLHDTAVGPAALGLRLTLADWCADGLLAVFFFAAGLELKREVVAGDLRDPRRVALPVVAAAAGMAVPAAVYAAVNLGSVGRGWAVPTATDIAFALAVLAVINTHLPAALRTFLLTLAVVDDLIAIVLIAVVFTDRLDWACLGAALGGAGVFWALLRSKARSWWALALVALVVWWLVHASGVHATVAGMALGFMVPVGGDERGPCLAERLQRRIHPYSAFCAAPLFAFFATGVKLGGLAGLGAAFADRAVLGVVLGLVVGKCAGVFGAAWALARCTRAELDPSLRWRDMFGVSLLAGVGFTVSLLIGDLAFGEGSLRAAYVKIGVLAGSMTAAIVAGAALRLRNRAYRLLEAEEAEPRGRGPYGSRRRQALGNGKRK